MLALDIALADQFTEVQVAVPVLAQQHQARGMIGIVQVLHHDIGADDGLDASCLRLAIELHQREQIELVGQCNGRHAMLDRTLDHGFQTQCAVHQGVFRVEMKVDESVGHRVLFYRGVGP